FFIVWTSFRERTCEWRNVDAAIVRSGARTPHAWHGAHSVTSRTSRATRRLSTWNATRRFLSRPAAVALLPKGREGPKPRAASRPAATPRLIRYPTTASARACERAV